LIALDEAKGPHSASAGREVPRTPALALLAALVALPAVGAAPEACRSIADDAARLACYDRAYGSVEPTAATATEAEASPAAMPAAAPASTPPDARPQGWFGGDTYRLQSFAERWELDPEAKDGVLKVKPYQAVYLLPVSWRQNINVNPCSPNPANCATGTGSSYQHTEAKFQVSLKTKFWQDILGSPLDLWVAYTQQSFWQVYDAADSRPFRETDYQPEAWLTLPLNLGPQWLQWRMLNLGAVHQSNGQTDPLSRSWNRVYATFGFTSGELSLFVKPWWRIQENPSSDNNPDIADYAGRIELQVVYPYRTNLFSATLHNNLKFGSSTPNRTSVEANWAFPLFGVLHGYVQAYSGWADSLQNYNFRNTGLGIGVSLVELR
jgi:phospholipase A1